MKLIACVMAVAMISAGPATAPTETSGMSMDEAYRRLAERTATATTGPASEIEGLKQQIAALHEIVAQQQAMIASLKLRVSANDNPGQADRMREWDETHRLAPSAERGSEDAAHMMAQWMSQPSSSTDPPGNDSKARVAGHAGK